MATLRRSTRSTRQINYNEEFAPSYPDGQPQNEFERRIALLNQQSFPWKTFGDIDDILVYGLFASKRRTKGYRAIQPNRAFGEEDEAPITKDEGIQIRHICGTHVPKQGSGRTEDIRNASQALVLGLPNVFSEKHLPVVQQYSSFNVC
jgi:hypothetical protein